MCGEGVPYGDYPASEEKFMSICCSKWDRKFEWMAAEITGVNFEEKIWVNRIASGIIMLKVTMRSAMSRLCSRLCRPRTDRRSG